MEDSLASLQKVVQKHFGQEEPFYRIVDQGKRLPDRQLMHGLRNDHAAVLFSLESLRIRFRKNGLNAEWKERWTTMVNVLLPHLDQEEKNLFPQAAKLLSPDEYQAILKEMESQNS